MLEQLKVKLDARFGEELLRNEIINRQLLIEVAAADLLSIMQALKTEEAFCFEQLSDLCGVDYSTYGQADWNTGDTSRTGFSRAVEKDVYEDDATDKGLAVVYQLLSIKHNHRLRVRCFPQNDPARLPSVISIWQSADWYEREAFDLFGILFEGHPDLRRILTDYGFIGHPMRKDFPLEGHVEVRYDPDQARVIYQPVSIENRVLVPRVIRHDNRYEAGIAEIDEVNKDA